MLNGEHESSLVGIDGARCSRPFAWWHEYDDVVPEAARRYLSLEPAASLITGYHIGAVPALLQTEEYAWQLLAQRYPDATTRELGRLLEVRMIRQEILDRQGGPTLWVVLDEHALRRPLGDVRTMRAQLGHLSTLAVRSDVIVQVSRSMAGTPITRLRFNDRVLSDLVCLETLFGLRYPEGQADIEYYKRELSKRTIAAWQPAATPAVIRRILTEF